MSKIDKERGLVGPPYRTHVPYSTVDTRAQVPISRGDPLLAESKWSRGHVLNNPMRLETERRCQEQKLVETCVFRYPQGQSPSKKQISIRCPHSDQPPELNTHQGWRLVAGGVRLWKILSLCEMFRKDVGKPEKLSSHPIVLRVLTANECPKAMI